ncbi:MAG: hypothetical protein JXA99_03700 [Candidatus Lokiarchaeota archaeon]|nr:hypothetical protein [Candidatus Lokiarchaeota archaeon]
MFEKDSLKALTPSGIINIDIKYMDYFTTLIVLARSGTQVTYMEYDITDNGIRCLNEAINLIILIKYNQLFPKSMSDLEVIIKCKLILNEK